MGFSLDDFTKGVADIGPIVDQGLTWLDRFRGTTTAPKTTQPAAPAAPANSGNTVTQTGSGLAAIPPWMILAGAVVAIVALKGR